MSSEPEFRFKEKVARRQEMSNPKNLLRDIMWSQRWLLLLGIVLILVDRAALLMVPASIKYLFDDGIVNNDIGQLFLLAGLIGGSVVVRAATSYALACLLGIEGHRRTAELRLQLQKHTFYLPMRFFDRVTSGALATRIMDDTRGVPYLVGKGFATLAGGAITVVSILVFLVWIDPGMTLFVGVPLAGFTWLSMMMSRRVRSAFQERHKLRAEVVGRLTEGLGGIRVVKGFGAIEMESKIFHAHMKKILASMAVTIRVSSILTIGSMAFTGLAGVLAVAYGGQLVIQGEITTGELVSFFLLLVMLAAPISQITKASIQFIDGRAGLDRVAELLSWPQEGDDPRRVVTMPEIQGHLVFEDVHFCYDEDQRVLKEISFEVQPGTVVALVGSSGSGKSTVAALAASFRTPDKGRVLVDGIDLRQVKQASYRQQIGLVLQDDFMFDGTIRENIRFGRRFASDSEVQQAAEQSLVTEFSDHLPDRLDTVIGERGVKLSTGQRQRVAIARAMLTVPRILILDEPTSNLDTQSEAIVQKSLAKLFADRTTLVIAHRLSTIQRADVILVMENGRIVERGKHDALMARGGRYHRLYSVQARI